MDWAKIVQEWTPTVLNIVVVVIVPMVGMAIKSWLDKKGDVEMREWAQKIAQAAYWIVEQIARKSETDIDDKLAAELQELAEAYGSRVKPHKIELALRAAEVTAGRKLKKKERAAVSSEIMAYHERRGSLRPKSYDPPGPPAKSPTT